MIFEVPIDHFPAQQVRADRRPNLRLPSTVISRAKEVPTFEPLSPSVRRSQLAFPSVTEKLPAMRANMLQPPMLKRALTSPAFSVAQLQMARAQVRRVSSSQSSAPSRTPSMADLLKLPARVISAAASLHQLA